MKKLIIVFLMLIAIPIVANAKILGRSIDEETITTSNLKDATITASDLSNTYCASIIEASLDPTSFGMGEAKYYISLNSRTAAVSTQSTTETSVDTLIVPVAMKAHSLRVQLDGSSASLLDPWTVYLRDDAANSTLTCKIEGTAVDNCTDTSNTVSLAAGSKINLSMSSTGALKSIPTDVSEALISFCLTQ